MDSGNFIAENEALYTAFLDDLMQLAERVALLVERKVVEQIDEHNVRATGDLRKSIASEITRNVDEITARIFSGVQYAIFAHEGTRPHMPPIYPIMRWVERKQIGATYTGRLSKKGMKTITGKVASGNTVSREFSANTRSIAYAIAHGIRKHGTRGVKFFELGLKAAEGLIQTELDNFNVNYNKIIGET